MLTAILQSDQTVVPLELLVVVVGATVVVVVGATVVVVVVVGATVVVVVGATVVVVVGATVVVVVGVVGREVWGFTVVVVVVVAVLTVAQGVWRTWDFRCLRAWMVRRKRIKKQRTVFMGRFFKGFMDWEE